MHHKLAKVNKAKTKGNNRHIDFVDIWQTALYICLYFFSTKHEK